MGHVLSRALKLTLSFASRNTSIANLLFLIKISHHSALRCPFLWGRRGILCKSSLYNNGAHMSSGLCLYVPVALWRKSSRRQQNTAIAKPKFQWQVSHWIMLTWRQVPTSLRATVPQTMETTGIIPINSPSKSCCLPADGHLPDCRMLPSCWLLHGFLILLWKSTFLLPCLNRFSFLTQEVNFSL